jgi:N-acetylglucosamine-6-sulfatase
VASRRRLRLGGAALAAAAAVGGAWAAGAGITDTARAGAGPRPNIVFITTDDQTLAAFNSRTMPYTTANVAGAGTTFANSVVSLPLCCPSRAVHITGQYGHNNAILNNKPGYPALRDKRNVLPTWLKSAGYATLHVGRYLNEYPKGKGTKPGPGWDEWYTVLERRRYFDYDLFVNRKRVEHGDKKKDYLTQVLNKSAVQLVRQYAPREEPFFLQLDQFAPHSGPGVKKGPCAGDDTADPDPKDFAQFAAEPVPRPPSFDEEDISDKPSFIRKVGRITERRLKEITERYRCALASLRAVDRGVAAVDAALAQAGELERTVVIFTSDNGFFNGEHRLAREKIRPYEEALRVPLVMRIPQAVAGPTVPTVNELVANIDVAPTILELAGASPCIPGGGCRVMDGRSLLGLALGQGGWPQDRGIVLEFKVTDPEFGTSSSCAYRGLRTPTQVYIEHTSIPNPVTGVCEPGDEREHYDLNADPFQLENLYPAPDSSPAATRQSELASRLSVLADCAGIEGRDPLPPSGHYCQ